MKRFSDQPLRARPHLAVFGSDKVGNFVVTTPLLRGLTEKYPGCTLDFFGGETTRDLEEGCPHIDARFSLNDSPGLATKLEAFVSERRTEFGQYDLAINCDEFSEVNELVVAAVQPRYLVGNLASASSGDASSSADRVRMRLQQDPAWNDAALVDRFPELLESNYLAEIFCKLAYVDTDFTRVEIAWEDPPFEVPDVLVHMSGTRNAVQWLPEYWRQVIDWCSDHGVSVGLVGVKPEIERRRYHAGFEEDLLAKTDLLDLRGETRLPQLAGAFAHARAAIVGNTGPLHIAAAVGCRTILVSGTDDDGDGASPVALWAPRNANTAIVRTPVKCRACVENHFKNEHCLVPGHPCMAGLRPEAVIAALDEALQATPRLRHLAGRR